MSFPWHAAGILHRHARPFSLYPPISYSQASDHSVTDGLKNNMLLIGTPLVVTRWKNFIHSWRFWQCHSWSNCGDHCLTLFNKWRSRFKKYRYGGMTCALWLSFPINYSSVSVLTFVEANASLCQWYRLFVSILLGILSDSECLCPTLGMFGAQLVFPPPPVSLKRVDHLISGVLMAVVVGRLYEWPI